MVFWVVTPCGLVDGGDMASQPRKPQSTIYVRFQVLTATSMKMAVFWVVVPCSLVDITENSEVFALSIIITLIMEAVSTSEASVNFYHTTWHNNPGDSHRQFMCLFVKLQDMILYEM
jgi:hypothetical protein